MASSFKLPGILTKLSTIGIAAVFISIILTMTVVEVTAAFGQICTTTTTDECDAVTEECDGSQCACKTTGGFVQDGDSCRLPKYGEACSFACEGSSCVDDTCDCTAAQYYDTASGICEYKKGIGEACSASIPCFIGFECKSQVCRCKEGEFSPNDLDCEPKKAFSASCNLAIPNECKKNLTCIGGNCGCTQASHYYDLLDTFDCQPRGDRYAGCTDTIQCKDTLSCIGTTCDCDSDSQYYSGGTCLPRGDRDAGCTVNTQCKDTLSCIGTTCDCNSDSQYYSGGTCLPRGDRGVGCTFHSQCKDSLSCIGTTCDCDSDSQYYSGGTCRARKIRTQSCTYQVNECEDTLACLSGVCACEASRYLDSGQCQLKKTREASCDTPKECQDSVGLLCYNKKCDCDPMHYWDGYRCQPRKPYEDDCGVYLECLSSFSCLSGKCTCVFTTQYITTNNQQCVSRQGHGGLCTENRKCLDPLECTADTQGTKKCLCQSSDYYQGGNTCAARGDRYAGCTDNTHCKDILSCIGTKCDCDSGSQYYSGGTCRARGDRGVGCTFHSQCKDSLSCIGTTCDCNSGSHYYSGGTCQARKIRTQSCTDQVNECEDTLACLSGVCACEASRYLDSGQCQLKKTREASCDTPKECQDSVGLLCYNKKCDCDPMYYWDGYRCQPRKPYRDNCGVNLECLSSFSCLFGKCTCDFTTQYITTNNQQCVSRQGHGVPCTENQECLDPLECAADTQGIKKCLCQSSDYYQGGNTCAALTGLKVQNTNAVSGVDNIEVTWSVQTQDASVLYKVYNSPADGSQTVITNGMDLTGLTPGTEYLITIESYIPSNDNYGKKNTLVAITPSPWTLPSKPGNFMLEASQLLTNPMTFGFAAATGNVKEYTVKIILGDVVVQRTVTANVVRDLNLTFAKSYKYEIISVNGNGDESDTTEGNFMTSAAASSQVEGFSLKDKTATSVVLEWNPPSSPNGEIQFFFAQLFKDGSCIRAYYLDCSDCGASQVPDYGCAKQTTQGRFTTADTKDANHVFNVDMTMLQSYTTYTVKVFAVNQAGDGSAVEGTFKTDESAAEDLVGPLLVSSFREDSDRKVGLVVGWIPGRETGQTNYTVTLTDMDNPSAVKTKVVAGYGITNTRLQDLLAFHDYRVDVFAETRIGQGTASSMSKRTATAIPGAVGILQVLPDNKYARRMKLQFSCPLEQEWNGVIQKFIITKTDNSGGHTKYNETDFDCSSPITVIYSVLGSFDIKETYTFQVVTRNQDFSSVPSNTATFYVVPKEPVFERSVVSEKSEAKATKDTITVSLCSSCMTDDAQGTITHVGLIVCVKSKTNTCQSSRRKRATMTVEEFERYGSWAQAEENDDFNSPYRTTPDTWLSTLIRENPTSYVIGDNPTCDDEPTQPTYCNGPLPSGKEIVVTAVSCTEAGCLAQEASGFVLKTRAVSESSDDSTGIIVGVVVAVVVVAAVVAAAFVYMRIRRKKKVKEDPPHLPLKDLSDPRRKPIKIRDFKNQVAMLHRDVNLVFQWEFEDIKIISADFKYTNEEAQRECNRMKNRHVDILPYDHSRVKLEASSEGVDGSDFINANYIPGLNSKREYIASQGPMYATTSHFWTMVWEQKTKVIVMLTDLIENSRMKVHLYWPEKLNEPISYGDVVVEMTNFSQLNKYIIRNFKISMGNMDRRVTHFFIPGWWDFRANLTFDDVLEFAQLVRKEITPPDSGPLVVHCSDGVGRTGIFIALDYFMQYIERRSLEDNIDVFEYVLEMRKNRPRMVQTETQYIFIFDALVEVIDRKIKAEEEHLYDHIKPAEDNVYANRGITEDNNVYTSVITAEDTAIYIDVLN